MPIPNLLIIPQLVKDFVMTPHRLTIRINFQNSTKFCRDQRLITFKTSPEGMVSLYSLFKEKFDSNVLIIVIVRIVHSSPWLVISNLGFDTVMIFLGTYGTPIRIKKQHSLTNCWKSWNVGCTSYQRILNNRPNFHYARVDKFQQSVPYLPRNKMDNKIDNPSQRFYRIGRAVNGDF